MNGSFLRGSLIRASVLIVAAGFLLVAWQRFDRGQARPDPKPASGALVTDAAGQRWRIDLLAPTTAHVGRKVLLKLQALNATDGVESLSFTNGRQFSLVIRDRA